jgi:transcription initiation factor TFIID TATA-box-binding protein
MPKTEATVTIQNVVSTANLNQNIDLNAVVKSYPSVEYRPEKFPGVVLRLRRPKTAILIFSTGKMVCTGAKTGRASRRAIMKVVRELKKGGIIILHKPDFEVVNIVASASLGGSVDLEKTVVALRHTMYEPEQFPGLIHRMDEPKVVMLIFASGNLVCTGARKEQDVYDAVHKLHTSLEEQTLIFYE